MFGHFAIESLLRTLRKHTEMTALRYLALSTKSAVVCSGLPNANSSSKICFALPGKTTWRMSGSRILALVFIDLRLSA